MKKAFTFIIIFNLLFSIMGVAQYAHYCCDTMTEALFTPPSCDCDENACEEEEDSGCCKNDVKIVQLMQVGISCEKSEISKPSISKTIFTPDENIIHRVSSSAIIPSFLSCINGHYHSPPLYILNRLLLI